MEGLVRFRVFCCPSLIYQRLLQHKCKKEVAIIIIRKDEEKNKEKNKEKILCFKTGLQEKKKWAVTALTKQRLKTLCMLA